MEKLEICCGSIEDVNIARQYAIDSIELNSALTLGGLTPSLAMLRYAKQMTDIPIFCMNRVRPGGFVYSDLEFSLMLAEAKILLDNQADGIVFGFLKDDLTIDMAKTKEMIDLIHSYHKQAIFHMAIDQCQDLIAAYQQLITLHIDRVLTAGKQTNALAGIEVLRKLLAINPDKLIIGAGINGENINEFLEFPYIHASCKEKIFQNNGNDLINQDYVGRNLTYQVAYHCVEQLVKYKTIRG